jgi:EAL domain-containing protein (putative c-di-GMP-specific phosphodiesterase class I)/CheY-like chemotaxis protein
MTRISKLRFLVAEDHAFQRWHCCNVLRELGANAVFPATDGRAALELLSDPNSPIDVLITDLDMPEMDGMALIRKLAERSIATSLIVVTAMDRSLMATVEAMAQAYGVNFLGALEKPVTTRSLQALLARRTAPAMAKPCDIDTAFSAEEIAGGLRNGEFEVFLQPKVDLVTRDVKGAEALARWRHPRFGLVYPKAFMQTLESNGLADELMSLVAFQAAENCRDWRRMGHDISVSINLSVASLEDVSLADRLIAITSAVGLDPRHITLEITESAAARDLGRKLESLLRLRMKGFGLSIDDYGTGYSSMTRLSRVPFTELKIDQSFVRGAAAAASSRALVESSLHVATKLGISAVAEGVETRREWELLLSFGCPLAQGYFIARPMAAAQFRDWIHMRGQASRGWVSA